MSTPAADGFSMPAEWSRHKGCWMAWPVRAATFPNGLEAARQAYARVARAIRRFEPVTMVCPEELVADAASLCGPGIDFLAMPISDSWIRDNGPSFLVDEMGELAGVHWKFNAWGENYLDYAPDTQVGRRVLEHVGARRYEAPLVMEGGAFHVDGEGTCLTTEQCLLNPNRNPGFSKSEIEGHLRDHLGVQRIVWLGEGYEEDETDGHVDEIAAFVRPGLVLTLTTEDRTDPNYPVFQDNLRRLSLARDVADKPLQVVTVPVPQRQEQNGVRLTLSYTNFYMANGGIVMPAFNDPADAVAYDTFRRLWPEREIVQVDALDIVRGGGGIHCITQQQPG